MEPAVSCAVLFGLMIVLLVAGLPVAFTLGGIAAVLTLSLWGPKGFLILAQTAYEKGTEFTLIALPLFILMANFLEVSGIADDLYSLMERWFGRLPGGLAAGTIAVCALFAAMAGISGAAAVAMGIIAIPSMLKRNYDKNIVVGSVASGAALGILIPPSIIAIIYGSTAGVSVGKLFAGGMIPGIVLALMLMCFVLIRCALKPSLGPPPEQLFTWRERFAALRSLALPLFIVFAVLGTIYLGVATPTEAAGFGSLGALISCAVYRKLTWQNLKRALERTFTLSAMVMWIVLGAACFARIYSVSGISKFVTQSVLGLNLPPMGVLWGILLVWIVLGMFMETAGICLTTVPIFLPIASALGFDPLWLGIAFIMTAETGLLTPPFGMTLFWLQGVLPPSISMADVYRSVWQFVAVQVACLVLVVYFPQLVTWLPNILFK